MYKKIATSLCFALFLGLLSACSPKGLLHLGKIESQNAETPKTHTKDSENTNANSGITAPVALPPSFNQQPLKPGQSNTVYMPNGLPALKPMKGVNVDTLFSENIKDSGERFDRVENAVVDLRKEFETYKPSIVRLAAVEADIQNLIKELEVLLQETPANQPPHDLTSSPEIELQVSQLDPQPPPPPEEGAIEEPIALIQEQSKAPPKVTTPPVKEPPEKSHPEPEPPQKAPIPVYDTFDGIVAMNLRAGEHADKLRLVLDTNQKTQFSIDLDNDEKLIIIELPQARWKGSMSKNFQHSAYLESYSVEPINGDTGSMIVLSLKKGTTILQQKRLSPDKNTPYHRIYFDLKK